MFRKIFFVFLMTASLGSTQIAAARQDKAPEAIAALPTAFAKFSTTDALKLIFSDYNPATGRTAKILNEEQKPAKVRIDEAKIWKAQNLERLVIVLGIENVEGTFQEEIDNGSLCGACGYAVGLALFQKTGEALSLVAFKELENAATSGHGETLLDLAPYKLAASETLIGVRSNYMHMGAYSDMLRLYRVENNSLRQVFERDMGEGFESEGITTLNKLVLAVLPNAGGFNDFQVTGKISITDDNDNLLSESPVKELYLDFNNLQSLPPEIGKLENLRNLNLQSNRLKSLPAEIGQLKQLSWLNIGNDLADEANTQNQIPEAERKKIRTLLPNTKIEFP